MKKRILSLIPLIILIVVYGLKLYNTLICPFPKELREPDTVIFSVYFSKGINPYSTSIIDSAIPFSTTMYGFIAPLIMAPFVGIFSHLGIPAIQVCEILTLIIELVGIFFTYKFLKLQTDDHVISIFGAALMIGCFWRLSTNAGAFPDQWGVSGSILLMYLITLDKNREKYNPVLYSVIMIILAYTKQYFVLIIPGCLLYLLIENYRDCIKTVISLAVLSILSCVIVYLVFPLFFSEAFPMASGQTLSWNLSYSLLQIPFIFLRFPLVCAFAIYGLILTIIHIIRKKSVRHSVPYDLCQIITILIPTIIIAKNQGTNYTYYLQLLLPYLITYGTIQFAAVFSSVGKDKTAVKNVILAIIMVSSFVLCKKFIYLQPYTSDQISEWKKAYSLLDAHFDSERMLIPITLSEYCISRDIQSSEYGQAVNNNPVNLDHFTYNKIYRNIPMLRYAPVLIRKNLSYNEEVKQKVAEGFYSVIALDYQNEYDLTEQDLLDNGYICAEKYVLKMEDQYWDAGIYLKESDQ